MIFGVGTDIIEVERVVKTFQKGTFSSKYFTERENKLCEKKVSRAAVQFAGKEAVVKAFGVGFGKISPIEIEILRDEKGAPLVYLHGEAEKFAKEQGIISVHLSVSDTKEYASAFAVAEV